MSGKSRAAKPMHPDLRPPQGSFSERLTAASVITLAVVIGGASLAAFTVFLFAGPPLQLELKLGVWGSSAMNAVLSMLFFMQHSGMTRQSFKRWLARFIPAYYLGAVYAISSGLALLVVVLVWQESEHVIVAATGFLWWLSRIAFLLAVGGVIWTTVSLQGFDTLGVKPILDRGRAGSMQNPVLTVRGPYRWVRHPLYFFVLVMIWSHPNLTVDRALFNVLWSVWIVVGAALEERDLLAEFGDRYRVYQEHVSMLIPRRIAGWRDPAESR